MTKKVERQIKVTAGDLKRTRGGVPVESHLTAGITVKQKVVEHEVGEKRDYEPTDSTAP